MPIEDIPFYTVMGEEISRNILVEKMIQYYQLKLKANETQITDFNDGSEIRTLLEAIAVDIYALMEELDETCKINFVETAYGEWLDKHGANPLIKLPRETGERAKGYVTFTMPSNQNSELIIPQGTVINSTYNDLQYYTIADNSINVGENSTIAYAECLTEGLDGNCPAHTLTEVETNIRGLTVTNEGAFTGGLDYETDDEYRRRLLEYVRKDDFGSRAYYERLGENVDGVHDVLIDDTSEQNKFNVYVNGLVKPTSDTVLLDTAEAYNNQENILLGHTFNILKPTYKTVNLTIDLDVSERIDDVLLQQFIKAIFDGGEILQASVFEGLSIGEPLTESKIKSNLQLIESVVNISNVSSSSSLTPTRLEVLQLGVATFNQTEV